MDYLFKTYMETINPQQKYSIIKSDNVIQSVLVHLVIYVAAYKSLVMLFDLPDKTTIVSISLFVIMIFGYIGRLMRSKTIYKYYLNEGKSKNESKKLTINIMNKAYFTWFFLG